MSRRIGVPRADAQYERSEGPERLGSRELLPRGHEAGVADSQLPAGGMGRIAPERDSGRAPWGWVNGLRGRHRPYERVQPALRALLPPGCDDRSPESRGCPDGV